MVELLHPLQLWRLSQYRFDAKKRERVRLTITQAAKEFGVAYQTWWAWELPFGHKQHRIPDDAQKVRLFEFTKGQVRPDHLLPLPNLRGADVNGVREPSLSGRPLDQGASCASSLNSPGQASEPAPAVLAASG